MTEEVDLKLTAVYEDLEAGLRMIEEENRKERQEKARFEKDLDGAKRMLVAWLPDAMQPYAKLLDWEVVEDAAGGINPDFGWFVVKIPDLALITAFVKRGQPVENAYWVHHPAVVDIEFGNGDDWEKSVLYRQFKDHRVALARAYELMKQHMTEIGAPSVRKEPHSEPIQEEVNEKIYYQVLKKIRIEEVIEQNYGWKLEKHNKFLIALNDRNLIVNSESQIYYWNSKGETGDVIGWIIKREKLSTRDAISYLVDLYKDRFVTTIPEPQYVPLEQDLIDSNGQFDSPLAAFYSNYMLNELVKFINYQIIQQRLTQDKK
jgi:hypothetical protein